MARYPAPKKGDEKGDEEGEDEAEDEGDDDPAASTRRRNPSAAR
jgi:hypothetical protein